VPAPAGAAGFVWDDRLWQEVWDRHLSAVERHALAMDVLRRRWPPDPFERSVVAELARQWRRTARVLAVAWSVWVLFWGGIAVSDPALALAWAMASVGLLVDAAVRVFLRRLRSHAAGPPAVV